MSKGAYIGISEIARKAKDIYIGVDDVARRVKKGYIGVDGVARMWHDGGTVEETAMYSYNGVILPVLPEWDKAKYPYVVIKRIPGSIPYRDYTFKAYFLTEPCKFKEGGALTSGTLQFTASGDYLETSIDYLSNDSVWSNLVEHTGVGEVKIGSGLNQQKLFVWSNYTVMNVADGGVVLGHSEPTIPGEILGYRYRDFSAPKLPAWDKTKYPYAVIVDAIVAQVLYFMADPYIYDAETGEVTRHQTSHVAYLPPNDPRGEWEFCKEYVDAEVGGFDIVVWTSYDVMSTDGTVYFAGTKPVPAYD